MKVEAQWWQRAEQDVLVMGIHDNDKRVSVLELSSQEAEGTVGRV